MTEKIIFTVQVGSHLYGTNRDQSDHDYKRVVLPSLNTLIQYKPLVVTREYPQGEDGDVEIEVRPLQGFLNDLGFGKIYAAELAVAVNRPGAALEWWTQGLLRSIPRNKDFTRRTYEGDDVDRKAIMHTIRTVQEIYELNTTGTITFPRPNADFLKGVLEGSVTLDDARTALELAYEAAEQSYDTSVLPAPDEAFQAQFEESKLQILRRAYQLLAHQK